MDQDRIKIGNTTFFKKGLEGMTKTRFKELYTGKLTADLDDAWKQLEKFTKTKKAKKSD